MGQQGSHSDPSARVSHESTQPQSNDSGCGTNQKSKIFKGLTSRGKSKLSGNLKTSKKQQNSLGTAIAKSCGTNAQVESLPSVAKDLHNSEDLLAFNSHFIDKKVDDFQLDLGETNYSSLINPESKFDKGLDDFDELFCDARDSHSPNDETPYMSAPENGSSMELSIYDNPITAMSSSTITPVEDLKVVNVPNKLDKIFKSKLVTKDTLRSSHSNINAELSQSLMYSDSSNNRHDESKCSNIFSSKFGYSLESGMEAANIGNLYQVQNNNENIIDGGSSVTLSSDLNCEKHDLKEEMDVYKTKNFQPYKRHTSLNDDSDHSIAQMRTNGRKSHVRCSVNSLTFASLEEVVHYPKTVPEKLDFKQLDKFEGQMLISWLCSCFSESSQMDSIKELSYNDYRFLSIQFCTYLLAAGVIRKMEEKNEDKQIEIFKPDLMYYWAHTLALQTSDTLPGKLNVQLWPFSSQANACTERSSLGKPSAVTPKKEMKEESNLSKKPSEMTSHFVEGGLPQIAEYEQKLKELKQEVEKYRILSGIESLNCVMSLSSESSNNKDTKDGLTQTSTILRSSETQTSDFFENVCRKSLCERATSPIEDLKAFIFTTLGLSTQNHASKSADISLQTSFPLGMETGKSINFCKANLGSADQLVNSSLISVKSIAPLIMSSESILSNSSTHECSFANIPQELYSMTLIPFTMSNSAESVQQISQIESTSTRFSVPALPTGSIPPPPPLPDRSIPAPPPLPVGSIPPPPPLPVGSIPPPPPLPVGSIPPPPPYPVGSIPPPPPLPVGSIPPPPPLPVGSLPLLLPDGSIPPPPMLQSSAVDPIPPFGPPTSTVQQVPRKPAVLPKAAMKPLFWKRIQVPVETVHESDATPTSQCLWNILREPEMDFAEFEDLFAKAPTKRKNWTTKKEECKKIKEVVKLLDSKKSQALGIFITSLHLNVADIETALLEFDPSVLSTEMLSAFYEQRPEESEIELVRNFLVKHPDSILDRPEQFIYELSQIPCFDDRCYCFIFQTSFFESLSSIEQRLINVKMIVENIMCNPNIETIFGLILALGNYMNGGTARGQADGFGLDILSKLKDVKSKDNTLSLLEYIVKIYLAQHAEDGSLTEYVPLPIPEPSDVMQAANVNFDDLNSELDRLDSSLDGCELKIKRILFKSTKDTLEPFQGKMGIFMRKAKIAMNEQENNLLEVKKKYESCVCFFMANSQRGEDNFMSLKDFFGLWVTFCQDFKDVWKKEMQRIAKLRHQEAQERLKKMQEEKKSICTRMPVNKSGLKAKLTSKGII